MNTVIPKPCLLTHNTERFTLNIPEKVEKKIRYLCSKINTIEWSGVLFYTHTGSIANKDLVINCEDIFLKDIGNGGYTEFDVAADETTYMVEHDLIDCQTGLLHSHHTMAAFFSGTDQDTLLKEGKDTNSFVSLIVNNAGKYVAAVTQRLEKTKQCKTNIKAFSFDDNPSLCEEEDMTYESEVVYYDLDIVIENSQLTDIDDRIAEIKEAKTALTKNTFSKYSTPTNTKIAPITPYTKDLFTPSSKVDTSVQDLIAKLLTTSMCINPLKFDITTWMQNINAMYERAFLDEEDFHNYAEVIIDYLLCYNCMEDLSAENISNTAKAVVAALNPYSYNKYVAYYINICNGYILS